MADRPFGLVLAGGLARRMEGRDKALMELDAQHRLLDILLACLAPQCAAMAISANGDPARFAGARLPVLADLPGPSRGPLAGVLAGLACAANASPQGWMLTVPGDTPFVPRDLVARLMTKARETGMPVVRANRDGRVHPLVAVWSCRLHAPLHTALMERDQRKVTAFQAEVGVAEVFWTAAGHDPFFNINTPQDLEAARLLHRRLQSGG